MSVRLAMLIMLSLMLLLACSSNSGDIDAVLSKAKAEGKIVMLELGSVGCSSCEQMKPVIQKLRDAYPGKLEVIFVDVREDSRTGRKFRVIMMPTQVFLNKSGTEIHRHIGFYSYEEILPVLKKAGI